MAMINSFRGTDALVAKMEKEEMELIQRWEMDPKCGDFFFRDKRAETTRYKIVVFFFLDCFLGAKNFFKCHS